jgi:hypothetical protein
MLDEMKAKFFDKIRDGVNNKERMLSEVIDEVMEAVEEYDKWEAAQSTAQGK